MRVQLGEIVMKIKLQQFMDKNHWLPGSLEDLIIAQWADEELIIFEIRRILTGLERVSQLKSTDCGALTAREKRFLKEFGEAI